MRFLYLCYALAPVGKPGATLLREAKRLAAYCNKPGDCTVGALTCPFIIHGHENDHSADVVCETITTDDWLRVLVESSRNLPEDI